ncbi:C2 domain-containing protein [Zychaea mexicana]|uniref:C2 domain-containing protein n=1 Tax=Zychaea mexicana TaxID=64656 RepID=UPI0022FE96D1|nr:C2 domain-containing protein [Zychaea mexicana]KAI9485092.1 C2 domain-containing protein [Zychaea mexicana]
MTNSNGSAPSPIPQQLQSVPKRMSSLPSEQRSNNAPSATSSEKNAAAINLTADGNPAIAVTEELSPAEKAARAKESIQSTGLSKAFENGQHKHAKGQLATDLETSDSAQVMQAVANASAKPVARPPSPPQESNRPPGAFGGNKPQQPAQNGWTSFSKLPNPGDEKAMEELSKAFNTDALVEMFKGSRDSNGSHALNNDLLAQYMKESYYGEWYHNAAVILFTVVFTWLLTKLGGGLMACLVVGAFSATYYQTSIRRLRRNIRDDMEREVSSNRLETDIESADWINHFVTRFWLIYEPVLSAQIIGTADAILIENTPSFLDSIRLTTFTLGTKPFRINGIKTYPKTEPNVVVMDWTVSFIPNDVLDLTPRELQSKINPKIVLTIRVGKGMIGAGMPVLLEDLAFKGTMRLKFKLFNEFPHVKTVEACFLEKPLFDYSLKPVGGETFGFDINNIPGLQTFVQEQVHATLGPMMYAPNVYTVDVAGMMAGTTDLTAANGVLAITVYSATNLKAADLFGSLDPYITFHIGNAHNAEMGRTSAFEDTNNPKWDETHFVLLNNTNETVYLQVMDRNSGRKDSAVGVASFDLKELANNDNAVSGLNLSVQRSGKPVGEVKCDMQYFPVSKPEKKEDGTIIPPAESNSGVLRFTVHECKGLGGDGKRGSGIGLPLIGGKDDLNAYAVVKVNGQDRLRTKPFKRSVNPRWDKFIEVFVADKTKLDLGVNVIDSKEFTDDDVIGRWRMSLANMEDEHIKQGLDWWNLKDGPGKIHLSAMWKPIVMTGFAEGLGHGHYRPPIGVVRLHFFGARDLKNVEAMTGGKSDPYIRVLSGMQVRAQCERVDDNLDPDWDATFYVPVHSIREDLIFEVMDYNDIQKDKSLGLFDFLLKDIVKESKTEDGQAYYEPLEAIDKWVDITSVERKKGKGKLHFAASFIPAMELPKPESEKKKGQENQEQRAPAGNGQVPPATPPQEAEAAPEIPPEKDLHGELIKYTADDKGKIDLLAYESGILSVSVHTAKFPERVKASASILLDSNDPQYRTVAIKGVDLPFNETGDAFVKEMDFSKLVVRVQPVKDSDKDDSHIGYYTSSVRDIVRKIMERQGSDEEDEGEMFKLLDSDLGSIRLSFRFTPVVNFKLDPSESLENQGNLTVTPLKATNLTAADRSGTSDPFIVFSIAGEKVHKTETYKKTLNPVFKDEQFTAPVPNRTKVNLVAEIYDWDQFGKDSIIGQCEVSFTGKELESFAAKDFEVSLKPSGSLRLRMLWQPQLLARKRTGTSLLGSTTRIFTSAPGAAFGVGKDIAGVGFGAGTKVLGTGGKVIGGGVSAIGSGIGGGVSAIGSGIGSGIRGIGRIGGGGSKREKSSDSDSSSSINQQQPAVAAPAPVPTVSTTSTVDQRGSMDSSMSPRAAQGGDATGAINVTLVGARNLKAMDRGNTSDPYARVRIGGRIVHKTKTIKKTLQPDWNETFLAKISDGKTLLDIKIKDKNTLNDVDIGDCSYDVADLLQSGQSFDGWVPLEPQGTGEVRLRIEVTSSDSGSSSRGLFGKIM